MENYTWQPLSGISKARIYPYLRKVSVVSSNSAIIATPGYLLVIDPGALPEQRDDLRAVIARAREEQPRRVMVLLTHCHVDHSLQAREVDPGAIIAIQENGARFLAAGDIRHTQAELTGRSLAPFQPELPLLTVEDAVAQADRVERFPGFGDVLLKVKMLDAGTDRLLFSQRLQLDDGTTVTFYYTPGHGPDCCCIRVGSVFFIGDLLFAAKPFIAGVAGWDQAALLVSVRQMRRLLEADDITLCVPGHGAPLEAAAAKDALETLLQEIQALDRLPEVNRQLIDTTAEYALALGVEASDIFTIIAGRLLVLEYRLEQLGESGLARYYADSFAAEKIDDCLLRFNTAVEELRAGKRLTVEVVLLALASVQRIQALYQTTPLESVIEPALLRRAMRLLLDFLTIARGLPISDLVEMLDLNAAVHGVLAELLAAASPRNLLEAGDDEDAFLAALVTNLARMPILERMPIHFTPSPQVCQVSLPPQRFGDTLAGLLEDLAGFNTPNVEIAVLSDNDACRIELTFNTEPISPSTLNAYQRHFAMCGVEFAAKPDGITLIMRTVQHTKWC